MFLPLLISLIIFVGISYVINNKHNFKEKSTNLNIKSFKIKQVIHTESELIREDYTANRVIKNVRDGDIILMHDIYSSLADAVKVIVRELTKKGYQFVTVSELLSYKSDYLEVGQSYYNK